MMERDNRKSHLASQLSPATQNRLRPSDSPTSGMQSEGRSVLSPTSGEIPIAGAGIVSPRDHPGRSPGRNGPVVGRAPAVARHPGMGARMVTTSSIPQSYYPEASGSMSASATSSFSLPIRPAQGQSVPPPAGRRHNPEELRREGRRQANFGLPPHPSPNYGS